MLWEAAPEIVRGLVNRLQQGFPFNPFPPADLTFRAR